METRFTRLTALLISRFILSIHTIYAQGEDETTFSGQPTLQFANTIQRHDGVFDSTGEDDNDQPMIYPDHIGVESRPYQSEHETSMSRGEHL